MATIEALTDAQDSVLELTNALDYARAKRDEIIGQLASQGVSAYRMAQELGISQQATRRIVLAQEERA